MTDKKFISKTAAQLQIGDRAETEYTVTEEDLRKFAEISGDWNPLHFDEVYAKKSIFRQRIAHGLISLAKFSGIFGTKLPGEGTLWETQEVRFLAPVFINKIYRAIALVIEKNERRVTFQTWVEDENGVHVLDGRGVVLPITENFRKRLGV